MFDLTGKRALVTGATGGLGGEIARALHAQGAHVALSGTRTENLTSLAQDLGERAVVCPCDLAKPEGAETLIKDAETALGGLDILVANAGITRDMLVMRMKEEDWDHVMELNLKSVFKLAKASLRGMMKQRWGRIITITSVVGVTGNAGQANYAASKAGLIGFSKSLAFETASRGLTVNCLAPGFITSPMTDVLTEEQKQAILTKIPMNKMGHAKDIAAGVIWLASEEASYVTGQTLHINGGMLMV